MVRLVRAANPAARFNLEVITRDALPVPIYTEGYWNVFPDRPAAELAEFCQYLKSRCAPSDFPKISALPPDRQVLAERENIIASLAFARTTLKL
jgi:3-oxoisoapionate decarboxylase